MLKNILNVKGAKTLSKSDQKQVMGGMPELLQCCDPALTCCYNYPTGGCRYTYGSPSGFIYPCI